MPSYLIKHKPTGERRGPVYASSAEEACNLKGWEIEECLIQELPGPDEVLQPFIPTQHEQEVLQHYIDLNGIGLSKPERTEIIDILLRWQKAQYWDS